MVRKKSFPLRTETDSPAMSQAIDWLEARRYAVRRTSEIQLKIGPVNFYPDSGSINLDEQKRLNKFGLAGLKAVLLEVEDTLKHNMRAVYIDLD